MKSALAMRNLLSWMKHHQVASFFLLTFAISWGLGFSFLAVIRHGKFLLLPVAVIAVCSPGLSGIILSVLFGDSPKLGKFKVPLIPYLIILGILTLILCANQKYINGAPLTILYVALAITMALPVGYIVAAAYSRTPAVRQHMASLVGLNRNVGWSLLALGLPALLVAISIVISHYLGRQPLTAHSFPAPGLYFAALISIKFIYQFFFFNATGEEAGWRAFALPRLQAYTNPLIASLILTLFWVPWHFFVWWAEGKGVFAIGYWTDMYYSLIPATILIVWFYNRSGGSILAAGIVHASANTAFAFLPELDWPVHNAVSYAVAAIIVIGGKWWRKLPSDHPAIIGIKMANRGESAPSA